jgi:hypothetical protein
METSSFEKVESTKYQICLFDLDPRAYLFPVRVTDGRLTSSGHSWYRTPHM